MLTSTQARNLRTGDQLIIGLNQLSGKYPLRDHNNIAAEVTHAHDGTFVHMSFRDDCGDKREIKARPADTAFWAKAHMTDVSAPVVTTQRALADPQSLRQGDTVFFKLYSTAGNHPVRDPDNIQGTVLRAKTAAYVRISYVDGCGDEHKLKISKRISYVDGCGDEHKLKISKRTDRQFWSTCFADAPAATATRAVPVVQSGGLIQVRSHIETTRASILSITAQAKTSVDLLEDLKAHVDDRLATISDTLVALDEQLDTVRDELEQAVTKLES